MKKPEKCPNCGAPRFEGSDSCQYCGTAFESDAAPTVVIQKTTVKKNTAGCLLLLIILAVSVIAVFVPVFSSQITKAKQEATVKAYTDKTYAIGEAAAYQGLEITLTKVETSEGTKFSKPKAGQEFVIATVQIRNTGSETVSYNPLYFKMKNSQGQITRYTITAVNMDTYLSSGDLAPGGSVSGTVAFEEPLGDENLTLQYQDIVHWDDVQLNFKAR